VPEEIIAHMMEGNAAQQFGVELLERVGG